MRTKVRNLHIENETLRTTFQKSYQELLDAFTSFKKQIEDDQIKQQSERELQLLEEIERKNYELETVKKTNEKLTSKLSRIQEAFEVNNTTETIQVNSKKAQVNEETQSTLQPGGTTIS